MEFEKTSLKGRKVGKFVGYIFGYFLFTTILFYILHYINKLPENWSFYHIMGITILIILIGGIIKRLLK